MTRRLAAIAALAGVGFVAGTAPAHATDRPVARVPTARALDFEQPLRLGSTIAPRGIGRRSFASGVVRTPERFDLVGLRWRSPLHVAARIRVRDPHGRWSPWTPLAAREDGGAGSEPVWTGGSDAYEVRMDRVPRGLRAHFVNTTGTATAADRARTRRRAAPRAVAAAPRQAGRAAPPIIPRASWGASQCKPRTAPSYGAVQVGFVHHTVSPNDYSAADSAAMVLAICRYHRNANGWHDIGYNFLVDRYGQIFEGRAGGIDQAVVGAQAQGYNSVSTGVANLGTYSDVEPTPEQVHATAELLAWKLTLHGVPVTGHVTVRSGGGPTNRYRAGTAVTLQRISGHRDADATECPGGRLYAQLAKIRTTAAALAPSFGGPAGRLTLAAADRTLDYPQAAAVSGRLTGPGGAPLAGVPVAVQRGGGARFSTYRTALTGVDGSWSASVPTAYTRMLRAVVALPGGARVTSPRVQVLVAPSISLRAPTHARGRHAFAVGGAIRPRRGRVTIALQRRSRGRLRAYGHVTVKVRAGAYAARLTLRRPGLYRLRTRFAGDARNSRAASVRRDVRVRS